MTVRLASTLPKGEESNGLAEIVNQLVAGSDKLHVAVVILDIQKITHDVDTAEDVPTVRVRRIEPVLDVGDKAYLGRIATRAFERRRNQTVLPMEMEDEVRSAFGELDE